MDDDNIRADLLRLINAHKRSVSHLVSIREQSDQGQPVAYALLVAVAAEAAARTSLLDWVPPARRFAIEKFTHLLIHAMVGDLGFDELSLAAIVDELQRFRDTGP
jgi:hypothetical protein